ncbi:MAG: NUDIX domain-containing protein [Cyanobacteriota bacterium]|nr:NUDIX domain-containing protein [Cyanobacteriota bacterium]
MSLPQAPPPPASQRRLAVEAELADGPRRFVRERLRLPMGLEGSFGWLRHPPSVMVVPRTATGHLLLVRRCRPAVGRWVLEFPSGPLEPGEPAAAGAARLLRRLTGQDGGDWRDLGQLRPNPGYSDELMALGWMEIAAEQVPWGDVVGEEVAGEGGTTWPPRNASEAGPLRLWCGPPAALEAALSSLAEPVDGRSASAWFLARRRGGL